MRIGIDATAIFGPRTGIENYIIHVINNLIEIDHKNQYFLYFREVIPEEINRQGSNFTYRVLKIGNRKIYQQVQLPIKMRRDRVDVAFYPGNTYSLLSPGKTVVTIHDIFPFVVPDYMPKYHRVSFISGINNIYWKLINKLACKYGNRIISVSESTRSDILKVFGTSPDKITVIHEAATNKFSPIQNKDELNAFKNKYNIDYPFILCVGTGYYKNIQGSIEAFSKLKLNGFENYKLVITGPAERLKSEVKSLINSEHIRDDIVFLGYFPSEEMPLLFNCAEMLLFPSFYEGFGIPVLEAFICGLPVLTSNTSSLPEISGEAAILVDPFNTAEISSAIESILTKTELRESLIEKGLTRAKDFSWRDVAIKTLHVFEQSED